jgi:hypothetical protein
MLICGLLPLQQQVTRSSNKIHSAVFPLCKVATSVKLSLALQIHFGRD